MLQEEAGFKPKTEKPKVKDIIELLILKKQLGRRGAFIDWGFSISSTITLIYLGGVIIWMFEIGCKNTKYRRI